MQVGSITGFYNEQSRVKGFRFIHTEMKDFLNNYVSKKNSFNGSLLGESLESAKGDANESAVNQPSSKRASM